MLNLAQQSLSRGWKKAELCRMDTALKTSLSPLKDDTEIAQVLITVNQVDLLDDYLPVTLLKFEFMTIPAGVSPLVACLKLSGQKC